MEGKKGGGGGKEYIMMNDYTGEWTGKGVEFS